MTQDSKLILIKELVDTAEDSLRAAKKMLAELVGKDAKSEFAKKAEVLTPQDGVKDEEGQKIVEGIFDGEKMVDNKDNSYPVPANYASKSKLVPGDTLKLTIKEDGSFLYKQIGPVERKKVIGVLTYEDSQYKVIAGGKAYKVLLASVTYHKAEIGDQITLIVPEKEDSKYGAIENVIPKDITDVNTTGEF
jgi:hypothetical protein